MDTIESKLNGQNEAHKLVSGYNKWIVTKKFGPKLSGQNEAHLVGQPFPVP